MIETKFDEKLLAEILIHSIDTGFCDYLKYLTSYPHDMPKIANLTKQDIIQLANQILSKETLEKYPEFELKKPDLFTKLDDATNKAKDSLETKREILHQICLDIMDEFPSLQAVTIQSVEYAIIKITYSNQKVENSTYIAINDEDQLKQNAQEFLNKVENEKGN